MQERPVRILMVDDEPDVELLIRQRFKRRPEFEFRFARNGQEALERLQEDPAIDILITDINMPVMDGLTLLSRVSTNGDRQLLKSVILSAYGDMPNIRTAMNRGAFDFLLKPIDFQDFEITIGKTLKALAAAREGLEASAQLAAIQQELQIASRIQQSMLPAFPAFPDRGDFAIYGGMAPAREVGGDFYDFFLIDEHRLGFVIGDISGKGVPAALFMAVSRTLLAATALQGLPPAECFAYVNEVLGRQGEDAMFVTAFYGILHTRTGELEFCRGGHNPPIVVTREGLLVLDEPGSVVLGLLPDARFETGQTSLDPGDTIFLYTDGLTEAMTAEGRFFSEKRLKALLTELSGKPPSELTERVLAEVQDFSRGTPQADDITMLAVQRQ